jgi:hypothetical protein
MKLTVQKKVQFTRETLTKCLFIDINNNFYNLITQINIYMMALAYTIYRLGFMEGGGIKNYDIFVGVLLYSGQR